MVASALARPITVLPEATPTRLVPKSKARNWRFIAPPGRACNGPPAQATGSSGRRQAWARILMFGDTAPPP